MRPVVVQSLVVLLAVCPAFAGNLASDFGVATSPGDLADEVPSGASFDGPGQYERVVPDPAWIDRPYWVNVPESYEKDAPLPLIVVLHGSGSNAVEMARTTCRGLTSADMPSVQHPTCLHHMATGAITAYLNGSIDDGPIDYTEGGFRRSWNAGGGRRVAGEEYKCISNSACENSGDDVSYVVAVIDDAARHFAIDPSRVYAVGISNGGAMAHRLACEVPWRFAAVAAVAGTSHQYMANLAPQGACASGAVGVLQIFGEDDPISPPGGGLSPTFPGLGWYVSIDEMLNGFHGVPGIVERNGCSSAPPTEEIIPNSNPFDGSPGGIIYRYQGCERPVAVYRIWGGGHTWPDGWQYFGQWLIGPTNRDISANREILAFFGM